MRVRISGIVGVAALVAGVIALAAPQAGAQPASDRSAVPLIDTTTPQSQPHSAAPTNTSPATGGRALSITVTSCSAKDLIAAITAVNSTGGTVKLLPGCTYVLTCPDNGNNGLPIITNEVTIDGAGATITRSSTALFRIFEVDAPGNLTLNNLILSKGHSPEDGGAILTKEKASALTLNATWVTDNTAEVGGGGLLTNGTVTVNNSTVSRNTASRGGGMETDFGKVTVTKSTIAENTAQFGGGVLSILNYGPSFDTSRIVNNTALTGGGVVFSGAGNATINNSLVAGNTANNGVGGGISNDRGNVALRNTVVIDNHVYGERGQGGGIYNIRYPGFYTSVTLQNSVVAFNTASDNGGGIYNLYGMVYLIETPLFGNSPNNCGNNLPAIPGCPD